MSEELPPPTPPSPAAYARGAVRPVECYRAGWQLIKDDYWLFLGISLVGTLIASLVPLGILAGPMMCGIYLCLLRKDRGRRVRFEMLFKGFDYFVPSLIATLIMVIPILVIVVPAYIIFIVAVVAQAPQPGGKPDPNFGLALLGGMGIFYALLFVLMVIVSVLFFFTYPLIVDRGLSGPRAVGTSIRAAMANLGGVLGVVLLSMLFGIVGLLACCVGGIFITPIHLAAVMVAYRQAFPEVEGEEDVLQD